jgi:hypothetical protein
MARTTISPTLLTADSGFMAAATIADSFTPTAGAGNGVQFNNAPLGQVLLVVNTAGTPTTLTVVIGQTLLGQSVGTAGQGGYTVGPLAATASTLIGPFHAYMQTPGTFLVSVDFSAITSVTCGVVQIPGVY